MPLITGKSPKAFSHNVKAEMAAGKPQKQSVAIAYAKAREAGQRKKLWQGGLVGEEEDLYNVEPMNSSGDPHTAGRKEDEGNMSYYSQGGRVGYADGGMVPSGAFGPDMLGQLGKEDYDGGEHGEELASLRPDGKPYSAEEEEKRRQRRSLHHALARHRHSY